MSGQAASGLPGSPASPPGMEMGCGGRAQCWPAWGLRLSPSWGSGGQRPSLGCTDLRGSRALTSTEPPRGLIKNHQA